MSAQRLQDARSRGGNQTLLDLPETANEVSDLTIAGSTVPVVRHVAVTSAEVNAAGAMDVWPEMSEDYPKGYDWEAIAEFD